MMLIIIINLTNSVENSSWEINSYSHTQIIRLVCDPKVNLGVHMSLPHESNPRPNALWQYYCPSADTQDLLGDPLPSHFRTRTILFATERSWRDCRSWRSYFPSSSVSSAPLSRLRAPWVLWELTAMPESSLEDSLRLSRAGEVADTARRFMRSPNACPMARIGNSHDKLWCT